MAAASALTWFLRALGVPGPDVPPEPDERAALYRSLLAGRRMLVVLDNAGSAEQVRLLLPGTVTCGVLVTSRDSLAGLVARDGAARLDLDLLPMADAVALLRTLIGARADAGPGAAEALARQCSRLPRAHDGIARGHRAMGRKAGRAVTGSVPWPCSPAWALRKPRRSAPGSRRSRNHRDQARRRASAIATAAATATFSDPTRPDCGM